MNLTASLRPALAALCVAITAGGAWAAPAAATADPSAPPEPMREFRGAWVATVNNIDWPSKPGLPSAEQQAELIKIMDRAVELRLNAIVLQVRPACDALYDSKLEPWSEYLTGEQGKPPEPYYDPLTFACDEAHKRGLELHCWFNPYRARLLKSDRPRRRRGADTAVTTAAAAAPAQTADADDTETTGAVAAATPATPPAPREPGPTSPLHVSRSKPDLVRTYGALQWMDPGDPATAEHSLAVILDVVKRYDIDGVHMDDYFYPYPIPDAAAKKADPDSTAELDFPDSGPYAKYKAEGGKLGSHDFRRMRVDEFIKKLNDGIHAVKPDVQFGLSPFGIWRPGFPASVKGFDQHDKLYADARLWLNKGWIDYYTPQLYWRITAPEQAYGDLLKWWLSENTMKRHIWPGLYTTKYDEWTTKAVSIEEIPNQIMVTRLLGAGGNVHFSFATFNDAKDTRLEDRLTTTGGVYAKPAVVPETAWLPATTPAAPVLALAAAAGDSTSTREVTWTSGAAKAGTKAEIRGWLVQTAPLPSAKASAKTDGPAKALAWTTKLQPAGEARLTLKADKKGAFSQRVAVRAMGKLGRLGPVKTLDVVIASQGAGVASDTGKGMAEPKYGQVQ